MTNSVQLLLKKLQDSQKVIIASVIINLVLPMVAKNFATAKQVTPPEGAAKLDFFDQVMHMLVHHAQVPLTSSIVVALIVFLSIELSAFL